MKTAKKINKKNNEWNEGDIRLLPFNLIRVLALFIEKGKPFLDSSDIKGALKLEDKQVGGIMAAFKKTAKGRTPLISPLFRVGRGFRWIINEEELPVIKKVVSDIKKYLNDGGMDT